MSSGCGQPAFSSKHINRLRQLGQFIHNGGQPFVFDGGVVGTTPTENEDKENAKQEARSATGSRKRQRAGTRTRPPGNAQQLRSGPLETAFGDRFRVLVRHYKAVAFEDDFGLWTVIRTRPLGSDGPIAILLVAIALDEALAPRSWAFSSIGTRVCHFPVKHTNFPDASICAYKPRSGAWEPDDGFVALLDHYSLWVLKSWHRTVLGWWPGPQVGVSALYRRREFQTRELCGCESGRTYGACHQYADTLISENDALSDFRRRFGCDYFDRRLPPSIESAASSVWKNLPPMRSIFGQ